MMQDEVERSLRRQEQPKLQMIGLKLNIPQEEIEDKNKREVLRAIQTQIDLTEIDLRPQLFVELVNDFPEPDRKRLLPLLQPQLEDIEESDPEPIRKTTTLSESDKLSEMKHTVDALKILGLGSSMSAFHKEFKISGVICGKIENRLSYLSLCSQILEGKRKGYKEAEIAYAVRRAVSSTSDLRSYLDSLTELSLEDLLTYIRSSYREKSASELFQDLNRLVQKDIETGQEFLFRALNLRQHVLLASEAECTIKYDDTLVQSVFLHSLKTGLSNAAVRTHMAPFLDHAKSPSDAALIAELSKISSEEQERINKVNIDKKARVRINEVRTKENDTEVEGMKPLLESVKALTEQVQSMQKRLNETTSRNDSSSGNVRDRGSWKRSKCDACLTDNIARCEHCWKCGASGHKSRECQRTNRSLNH